jgi:hypothetical protein
VLVLVLASTWLPVAGTANEATPEPQAPLSQPEVVVTQPTSEIIPTAVPTQVPPTAIPTTVPTVEPTPTPAPQASAGEPSNTTENLEPSPTAASAPLPTQIPSNTDALSPTSGVGPFTLQQSGAETLAFTYTVTTERTATDIHAELRYADGSLASAWWLQGQAGNSSWGSNGGAIDLTDSGARTQGSSFPVTLIVTAPAQITDQHSVLLYVRSTASTERGEVEVGVGDQLATATFSGVKPVAPDEKPAANPTPMELAGPEGDSALSVMSVVEGGTLSCVQNAPTGTDAIDVDEFASFQCTHGPGPVRLRVNALSLHWEYRIDSGPWTSMIGQGSLTAASGDGGKNVTYLVDLRFIGDVSQVPPGSEGQVEVEITSPAGQSLSPGPVTATLAATRIVNLVPTADDFGLTCIPDAITADVGDEPIEVVCTFSGKTSLSDRVITLTQLLVTSPEGWTMSGEGTVSGSTLTLTPDQSLGTGSAYNFSFFLTPTACDTVPGTVTISSAFTYEGSGPFNGPGFSLLANTSGILEMTLSAGGRSLDFGTSYWNGTEYSAARGALAMTIYGSSGGACPSTAGNWSIQVSTDGLYKEDTYEQIPADAITYLGTQSNLDVPNGLVPVNADIPLTPGATTTIANGDELIGAGATWSPTFQLNPPNTAPTGLYVGSITIEIVNAP